MFVAAFLDENMIKMSLQVNLSVKNNSCGTCHKNSMFFFIVVDMDRSSEYFYVNRMIGISV